MKYSIFLLLQLFLTSKSLVIECGFSDSYYGYKCIAKNLEITSKTADRDVKRVYGSHLATKSADDVKFFYAAQMQINFFPQNLHKSLQHLETIQIKEANLKEVTSHDLRPFGDKLRNLWLGYNDIELIEADLFEFTPNIEWIYLERNKIKNVESGAFDGLAKLVKFNFEKNPCHGGEVSDKTGVSYLVADIEFKCQQTSYLLEKERARREGEVRELKEEIRELRRIVGECRNWVIFLWNWIDGFEFFRNGFFL